MKTILMTTFASALMVFAFNAFPAMASEECNHLTKALGTCWEESAKIEELKDLDQPDNEREVADSGDEGSTSAASASEQ